MRDGSSGSRSSRSSSVVLVSRSGSSLHSAASRLNITWRRVLRTLRPGSEITSKVGGGGLNPGPTQVRTLGLDQRRGGQISTSRPWVQPRFNPGSTQVQPRFNPGLTQFEPRFNPGSTQVRTQVPRFNPGSNSGSNPGSTQVQPRFNPGSTQVQLRFNPGSTQVEAGLNGTQ